MRLIKTLSVGSVALLALTGCSHAVAGTASPAGNIVGPSPYSAFDLKAAKDVLLVSTDLPDGYEQLPDVDIDELTKILAESDEPSDVQISPPVCAEFYQRGSLAAAAEMFSFTAVGAFTSYSSPTDISMVMEILGPPETVAEQTSIDVPESCQTMTVTIDGEQVETSITPFPVAIGSQSTGMTMTVNGSATGTLSMTAVAIVEPNGGLYIVIASSAAPSTPAEAIEIAQIAYDKAEPVLT